MTQAPCIDRVIYDNTCEENPGEFLSVGVGVAVHHKDLFGDPGVAHGVEDSHADPEPDVQGCQATAEVPTALQALHASRDCHFKSVFKELLLKL